MTRKEKAIALAAIILDAGRPGAERLAAVDELRTLAREGKTSVKALVGDQNDPIEAVAKTLASHKDQFEATDEELSKQKVRQEVQAEKDPLEELPEGAPEPLPPAKPGPKGPRKAPVRPTRHEDPEVRGKISEMARKLLLGTDAPYSDICEQIKAKHPHAVTTPRSLASVASEMRAKGEKVPQRRKPAKGGQ